jgi:hypothetical protein
MAFFGVDDAERAEDPGNMAGTRMRRNFRV